VRDAGVTTRRRHQRGRTGTGVSGDANTVASPRAMRSNATTTVCDDANVGDLDADFRCIGGVDERWKPMPHQRFRSAGVLRAVKNF